MCLLVKNFMVYRIARMQKCAQNTMRGVGKFPGRTFISLIAAGRTLRWKRLDILQLYHNITHVPLKRNGWNDTSCSLICCI